MRKYCHVGFDQYHIYCMLFPCQPCAELLPADKSAVGEMVGSARATPLIHNNFRHDKSKMVISQVAKSELWLLSVLASVSCGVVLNGFLGDRFVHSSCTNLWVIKRSDSVLFILSTSLETPPPWKLHSNGRRVCIEGAS